MEKYLIENLISPTNDNPWNNEFHPNDESYVSLTLSPTVNEASCKKLHYSSLSGNKKDNKLQYCKNDRTSNPMHYDYTMFNYKFVSSEDSESIASKEIFNYSPSDVKKASPVIKEICSPLENYISTKEEYIDENEQLTPDELEEYYYLKQKQAELEERIKQFEQKRINSDKSSSKKKEQISNGKNSNCQVNNELKTMHTKLDFALDKNSMKDYIIINVTIKFF